ncbi:MAG: hypothetical protein AAF449_03620 [Myxococcota bacterium]
MRPAHCANGEVDADDGETDVDCGGLCRACTFGLNCIADGDCAAGLACGSDQVCDRQTCEDGALNGLETDVDCGGPECFTRCGPEQGCAMTADCEQSLCEGGVCGAETCVDGILNGNETDVDCGGDLCDPCELGEVCLERRDCLPDFEESTECRADTLCAEDGLQDIRFEEYSCSDTNRCVRSDQGFRTNIACKRDIALIRARPDIPDPGDLDANCDGVDGERARSIFVSEATGSDGNDGLGIRPDGAVEVSPVRTLARAVELAAACEPTPCTVLVAEGTYPQTETLLVPSAVDIYGGFTTDWAHTQTAIAVQVVGEVSPTVQFNELRELTIIADLTIRGPVLTSPAGAESVALLVTSSTIAARSLVVQRAQIDGGRGAPGANGTDGSVSGSRNAGGAGGTTFDCGARGGATGGGANGGGGGSSGRSYCANACPLLNGDGISSGRGGTAGGDGANGSNGGAASPDLVGTFVGSNWLPSIGGGGAAGTFGGGGGGGGGGGTKRSRACGSCPPTLRGGVGGRGGDGGRGGGGGQGGGQGGGSFGVVLVDAVASFESTAVGAGLGGIGGRGGNGANGETALSGANGGRRSTRACDCTIFGCIRNYNSGDGGRGGNGGGGGGGAGGAGGNGGPAIGIIKVGTSTVGAAPVFLPGTAGEAGIGGDGGRQNRDGNRAPSGERGQAGMVGDEVQL